MRKRRQVPIQLEPGELYIKSYRTKQTQAVALQSAGAGMVSSLTTIKGDMVADIIRIGLLVVIVSLVFYGIKISRHKAHLTTKRMVFTSPGQPERSLQLAEIQALGTGTGNKKKVLMIDVGDGNPERNELCVVKHLRVADEIAQQARACGAKLK